MRLKDIIGMCINNLFRHASRTILTILGVIVGCCSVVLMMSFSVGMQIAQDSMMESLGDLQVIEVWSSSSANKINENTVKSIYGIENVIAVKPVMYLEAPKTILTQNQRFKNPYPNVVGINLENLKQFDYELKEGSFFKEKGTSNVIEVVAGEYFAYDFQDSQRPDGYNMIDWWSFAGENEEDKPEPYINPLGMEFDFILGDTDSGEKTLKYKLKVVGIFKEDGNKGYETVTGIVMSEKDAKRLAKEYNSLMGQYSQTSYDSLSVKANDINNVTGVEKEIEKLGYYTNSLESYREAEQKDLRQKQLMFAGIGAVSLFVAALGIMNTMIMAISERKREIGVMKAIGCLIGDIRKMFLMEAAFIGFAGGILGVLASYVISAAINLVSRMAEIQDFQSVIEILFRSTSRVSVIPLRLALGAVLFSIFVGIAAGFYPANSAVKITALEAIKSD